MRLLMNLVIAGFVLWAIWYLVQPRCAFLIQIVGGKPRIVRGKVTEAFLAELRETCNRNSVENGAVRGVLRGRRISLTFSSGIPPGAQQQIRNWWALSGWGG
jgi:hypothetical protein